MSSSAERGVIPSNKPKFSTAAPTGGGGVEAFHFGKNDFELGVGRDGQDTSGILKVVLGQYVQYCPCEASEQKLGQKPESELKVIELSYCHHSICL